MQNKTRLLQHYDLQHQLFWNISRVNDQDIFLEEDDSIQNVLWRSSKFGKKPLKTKANHSALNYLHSMTSLVFFTERRSQN